MINLISKRITELSNQLDIGQEDLDMKLMNARIHLDWLDSGMCDLVFESKVEELEDLDEDLDVIEMELNG